jgi:hypothetical protein
LAEQRLEFSMEGDLPGKSLVRHVESEPLLSSAAPTAAGVSPGSQSGASAQGAQRVVRQQSIAEGELRVATISSTND